MLSSIVEGISIPGGLVDVAVQILLSAIIPLIVAILGTRAQIRGQRRKEQQVQEADWFRETASICQLIKWSFTYTDNKYDVSDRLEGMSLNELGEETELAYLDEQMMKLLNHGSTAPKSINDETIERLQGIVFSYVHPHGSIDSTDLTFGELVDELENDVNELHDIAKEEEQKRTPDKSILTRLGRRILRE